MPTPVFLPKLRLIQHENKPLDDKERGAEAKSFCIVVPPEEKVGLQQPEKTEKSSVTPGNSEENRQGSYDEKEKEKEGELHQRNDTEQPSDGGKGSSSPTPGSEATKTGSTGKQGRSPSPEVQQLDVSTTGGITPPPSHLLDKRETGSRHSQSPRSPGQHYLAYPIDPLISLFQKLEALEEKLMSVSVGPKGSNVTMADRIETYRAGVTLIQSTFSGGASRKVQNSRGSNHSTPLNTSLPLMLMASSPNNASAAFSLSHRADTPTGTLPAMPPPVAAEGSLIVGDAPSGASFRSRSSAALSLKQLQLHDYKETIGFNLLEAHWLCTLGTLLVESEDHLTPEAERNLQRGLLLYATVFNKLGFLNLKHEVCAMQRRNKGFRSAKAVANVANALSMAGEESHAALVRKSSSVVLFSPTVAGPTKKEIFVGNVSLASMLGFSEEEATQQTKEHVPLDGENIPSLDDKGGTNVISENRLNHTATRTATTSSLVAAAAAAAARGAYAGEVLARSPHPNGLLVLMQEDMPPEEAAPLFQFVRSAALLLANHMIEMAFRSPTLKLKEAHCRHSIRLLVRNILLLRDFGARDGTPQSTRLEMSTMLVALGKAYLLTEMFPESLVCAREALARDPNGKEAAQLERMAKKKANAAVKMGAAVLIQRLWKKLQAKKRVTALKRERKTVAVLLCAAISLCTLAAKTFPKPTELQIFLSREGHLPLYNTFIKKKIRSVEDLAQSNEKLCSAIGLRTVVARQLITEANRFVDAKKGGPGIAPLPPLSAPASTSAGLPPIKGGKSTTPQPYGRGSSSAQPATNNGFPPADSSKERGRGSSSTTTANGNSTSSVPSLPRLA
jgi:hypothetical protein